MKERERGSKPDLIKFSKICISNLKRQSGWVIESGSSFHGIVDALINTFGLSSEEAIKIAQGFEREAKFKRGKSD